MARNSPVKLASARALAASAACTRASLSVASSGRGVGFRCDPATGGSVGEFDMFRAVSAKPITVRWYRLVGFGSSAAFSYTRVWFHGRSDSSRVSPSPSLIFRPDGYQLVALPGQGYALLDGRILSEC